jgi:hypothetical protein
MTRRMWTAVALAASGAVVATAAVADAGSNDPPPPSADQQAAVQARAHETLPRSRASLAVADRGGYALTLSVPAEDAAAQPASDDPAFDAPPPRADADVLPLAELGWKAHLVGGVAAADNARILSFSVTWPGQSAAQAGALSHMVRTEPGADLAGRFPRLGTVALPTARKQLASNLDVLDSALPPGTVKVARVVTVPVDASRGLFALEARIKVTRLDALTPHLGDVVDGLATGLVGDDTAVVEGLAIDVVDEQGARAGWWRTERTQSGFGVPGPTQPQGQVAPVDTDFPNLTGGPATIQSVSGGPGQRGTVAGSQSGHVLKTDHALGPVHLRETRAAVNRALGPGKPANGPVVKYKSGKAWLQVAYDDHNRVRELRGKAPDLEAYGRRLAPMKAALRRLKANGWTVHRCDPYVVAQHFGKHGTSSGVIWRNKHLLVAGVTVNGAIDVCPAPSPAA